MGAGITGFFFSLLINGEILGDGKCQVPCT